LITRPPYSDPLHSASAASIVGGAQRMAKPGTISCARKGVLFLDDSTEVQWEFIPARRHRMVTRAPASWHDYVAPVTTEHAL